MLAYRMSSGRTISWIRQPGRGYPRRMDWTRIRQPSRIARRFTVALLVTVLAFASSAEVLYASGTSKPLSTRLSKALALAQLDPANVSALVVDLDTGTDVFARNSMTALVPASTEKLPIALAALALLGPDFRSVTLVLGSGEQRAHVWDGDLFLKGHGDPTLRKRDLRRLARILSARGLTRITGALVGDDSYFDAKRTAPGWKASFYKVYSPPISALVLDRARKRGAVVDDPALAAVATFRSALRKRGITVDGEVRTGQAPADAHLLARDRSPRLSLLVDTMNTESDNFFAEMLLKTLGAQMASKGTTRAGARVVRRALAERDVPLDGVRIVDGSGLSRSDRLTTKALAAILLSAHNDPALSEHFVGSLAVAGVSGTLEQRFNQSPGEGRVQAKTGTTNLSSALAGLVDDRYAFAILMNGDPVNIWRARAAQDRFANILARFAS